MRLFWGLVTIVLAVAGSIGLYHEISKIIVGTAGIETVLRGGIALLCLVLAPKTYAKARESR